MQDFPDAAQYGDCVPVIARGVAARGAVAVCPACNDFRAASTMPLHRHGTLAGSDGGGRGKGMPRRRPLPYPTSGRTRPGAPRSNVG